MRKPYAGDQVEYLNRGWSRANRLLRSVYASHGPKELFKGEFRPVPPKAFYGMSAKERAKWDGMSPDARALMYRIAKHLSGNW